MLMHRKPLLGPFGIQVYPDICHQFQEAVHSQAYSRQWSTHVGLIMQRYMSESAVLNSSCKTVLHQERPGIAKRSRHSCLLQKSFDECKPYCLTSVTCLDFMVTAYMDSCRMMTCKAACYKEVLGQCECVAKSWSVSRGQRRWGDADLVAQLAAAGSLNDCRSRPPAKCA